MQTTTLSFANMHNHGELFANVFRARKQSFIDLKKWPLPEVDGMEFDQYDTPMSRWVAIHENGRVLAGVRLTPTTARCGSGSATMAWPAARAAAGMSRMPPAALLSSRSGASPKPWTPRVCARSGR